jgi:hypothetical protein
MHGTTIKIKGKFCDLLRHLQLYTQNFISFCIARWRILIKPKHVDVDIVYNTYCVVELLYGFIWL